MQNNHENKSSYITIHSDKIFSCNENFYLKKVFIWLYWILVVAYGIFIALNFKNLLP